jgi:hypothetical protein
MRAVGDGVGGRGRAWAGVSSRCCWGWMQSARHAQHGQHYPLYRLDVVFT